MKKPWTVVAAWVCWTAFAIGLAFPYPTQAQYPTVTFELIGADADTYTQFIQDMRDLLNGGSVANIPVLRNPSTVTPQQRFILVEISNYEEQSITFAIDVTDVYVVGYYLTSSNQFWYFKDAPDMSQLFPDSTKKPLGFGGGYPDLQRVAGQNRDSIELGLSALDQAIAALGRTQTGVDMKPVAKALIVVIQMVSEAIRFDYIKMEVEMRIMSGQPFVPQLQMISYENKWTDLCEAVQNGDGTNLNPPVILQDDQGNQYTVTLVSDIAGDLSLMKYVKPPSVSVGWEITNV